MHSRSYYHCGARDLYGNLKIKEHRNKNHSTVTRIVVDCTVPVCINTIDTLYVKICEKRRPCSAQKSARKLPKQGFFSCLIDSSCEQIPIEGHDEVYARRAKYRHLDWPEMDGRFCFSFFLHVKFDRWVTYGL